ncbi:hypothetical protein BH23ACT9_BH23ACT9_36380 [soil metagenome]
MTTATLDAPVADVALALPHLDAADLRTGLDRLLTDLFRLDVLLA